jgi:NAD(P)-dependent dehydrogenase (short-subunit alcohol dehydrogenase family)
MKYTAWLNKHIADLTGKTILVTGANSGLGYFTALQLAYRHGHIIMACRNLLTAEQARVNILKLVPNAQLTIIPYDQSSFQSIDDFVERVKTTFSKIDIIVLNAGIIYPKKGEVTPEGFPLTSGVNFFNIYYLLRQLLGYYDQRQQDIRVVFVGSFSSYNVRLNGLATLLNGQLPMMKQYAHSKLALAMLHHNLQMNLNIYDFPVLDHVTAVLCHPGLAATNIVRNFPSWLAKLINFYISLVSHSAESGALSITYAAGHPYMVNGQFVGPSGLNEAMGYPKKLSLKKHFSVGSAKFIYSVGQHIKNLKGVK